MQREDSSYACGMFDVGQVATSVRFRSKFLAVARVELERCCMQDCELYIRYWSVLRVGDSSSAQHLGAPSAGLSYLHVYGSNSLAWLS